MLEDARNTNQEDARTTTGFLSLPPLFIPPGRGSLPAWLVRRLWGLSNSLSWSPQANRRVGPNLSPTWAAKRIGGWGPDLSPT